MRLLSETVPRISGKVFKRKYIMLGRLVTRWEDIAGPEMAKKTQPVKLRYYKNRKKGGKATASLDIACSTADATVLHYHKDLILERINQIFGDQWITAIRFVPEAANKAETAPKKRPPPLTAEERQNLASLLDDVEDEEIRKKLQNLGSAILQDGKS